MLKVVSMSVGSVWVVTMVLYDGVGVESLIFGSFLLCEFFWKGFCKKVVCIEDLRGYWARVQSG